MEIVKNKSVLITAIAMCIMTVAKGFSQSEDTNDLENWTSISLKYKLNKKWSFELEEQLRLDENISEVSEYFTEFNAEYAIWKNFEIGGGLRYIRENDNEGKVQGYENHLRYHFDAAYKHELNNFSLKYRLRYQNKNELGVSIFEGDLEKQTIRFKTSVEYNINNWKLDPKFSVEIFNPIGSTDNKGFSKYRLSLGTEYKIKKFGEIGLYYQMEKELNVDLPETTNIIALKYTYSFKNKKNKKTKI